MPSGLGFVEVWPSAGWNRFFFPRRPAVNLRHSTQFPAKSAHLVRSKSLK
jgi:hypothetical protein